MCRFHRRERQLLLAPLLGLGLTLLGTPALAEPTVPAELPPTPESSATPDPET
ncbi:MAG: hypothetical protein K0S65_5868, partial [Labilithrix sp.]|nr:hypothetical protein [Labilithrix sp.]